MRCSPQNKSFNPKCVSCILPCETGDPYLNKVNKALSHHGVLHALLYMSINPTEMRLHLLFTISVIVLDIVMEYPGENAWCTMTSSSAYQSWGDYMQVWYFLADGHRLSKRSSRT